MTNSAENTDALQQDEVWSNEGGGNVPEPEEQEKATKPEKLWEDGCCSAMRLMREKAQNALEE